ncbi:hypothetical protein NP493_402g02010 [Ridgeia piscesae]|uniref:Uncharacterized protein n=1 Tax=Ridgeia piscesae TaxID=27915 RepID=A0AAD9L1E9_RIDPI|nr:hypothetical protein NP493_402g02010 [Ridgeia piscesae]
MSQIADITCNSKMSTTAKYCDHMRQNRRHHHWQHLQKHTPSFCLLLVTALLLKLVTVVYLE